MIIRALFAAAATLQGAWTWTLYEGDGPLVLANEIPDTASLRVVLECAPGSGVSRIDLYASDLGQGFATLASGSASAMAETQAAAGRQSIALRADHPVFAQFLLTGRLDVSVAERHRRVEVQPAHLEKLRRFSEKCA